MKRKITGVSAVNELGEAILFVEASMPNFDYFRINDDEIILENSESRLTRVYGRATLDAVSSNGVAIVQRLTENGADGGNYIIEVVRGL